MGAAQRGGAVVASGETKPSGKDAASGEDVQIVDFSTFKTPGKDYTLAVGEDVSYPFDIGADMYKKLKYDALAYFYQTRSGVEITMPFAGGKQWTRPAGHVGVAPNQGTRASPACRAPAATTAGRDGRLVRRRRPRQVRRQRRHRASGR